MALTYRQKDVLDFLLTFISRNEYSPSYEEIGESLGLRSLATVHKHVCTLERKGFIRRKFNKSRSIDVVALPGPIAVSVGRRNARIRKEKQAAAAAAALQPVAPAAAFPSGPEFPLLGRIAAGFPVEALPNPETFSLGDFASGRGNVYVLRVKGDSMIDDHICDGDYILVESRTDAGNGEIVVALVGGSEATLKRLFREGKGIVRLQPANAQMDPILLPAEEVQVQGRVIGVLRKY